MLNWFRQCLQPNKKGQTSLILILITALGLMFFAVSLNWGKHATLKNMTATGANKSVAFMASFIASYGEQLSETNLKGKQQYCETTSVILSIIVLVISIVAAFFTGGASLYMAYAAIALSAAALVINVVYIQPKITSMWNKMMQNMSIEDQVLEQGLGQGIQSVVQDNAEIPDKYDMDNDGLWYLPEVSDGNSEDMVSRYAYHYTRRLQGYVVEPPQEIVDFMDALNEMYPLKAETEKREEWTIKQGADSCSTAECNVCCVPLSVTTVREVTEGAQDMAVTDPEQADSVNNKFNYKTAQVRDVPGCLGSDGKPVEVVSPNVPNADQIVPPVCESVFNASGAEQPLAYDPHRETTVVTGNLSLAQILGRDDENPFYEGSVFLGSTDLANSSINFSGKDSSGLFSTFWKIADLDKTRAFVDESIYFDGAMAQPDLMAKDDVCVGLEDNVWKPGLAGFCSFDDPYEYGCQHHVASRCEPFPTKGELAETSDYDAARAKVEAATACSCTGMPEGHELTKYWAEDSYDLMRQQITDFAGFVELMRLRYQNPTKAYVNYDSWIEEAKRWISDKPIKYVDESGVEHEQQPKGYLRMWVDTLESAITKLDAWVANISTPGSGGFCHPDEIAFMMNTEKNYVDAGADGLEKVLNCLEFHGTGDGTNSALKQWETLVDACDDDDAEACQATVLNEEGIKDFPRLINATKEPALDVSVFDPAVISEENLQILKDAKDKASEVQAAFDERHAKLKAALEDIELMKDQLQRAVNKLNAFLTDDPDPDDDVPEKSPVEKILEYEEAQVSCIEGNTECESPELENFIIYGWKGEPTTKNPTGLWHVARSEAVTPKRCMGGFCETSKFPWIRTETKGFLNTKRCFYLEETKGKVAARITRWDQLSNSKGVVRMANDVPLWQFSTNKPNAKPMAVDFSACYQIDGLLTEADGKEATEAFMINKVPHPKDFEKGFLKEDKVNLFNMARQCFCDANRVLSTGTSTTACAQYFWSGQDMLLSFVSCQEDKRSPPFPENGWSISSVGYGSDICDPSKGWDDFYTEKYNDGSSSAFGSDAFDGFGGDGSGETGAGLD